MIKLYFPTLLCSFFPLAYVEKSLEFWVLSSKPKSPQ